MYTVSQSKLRSWFLINHYSSFLPPKTSSALVYHPSLHPHLCPPRTFINSSQSTVSVYHFDRISWVQADSVQRIVIRSRYSSLINHRSSLVSTHRLQSNHSPGPHAVALTLSPMNELPNCCCNTWINILTSPSKLSERTLTATLPPHNCSFVEPT